MTPAGQLARTWHDAGHAARTLRRTPGLTAVVVTVLAIGIGMSTALFAVVDGVLLRPLPYRDPSRLVTVAERRLRQQDARDGMSAADFAELPAMTRAFEEVAAYRPWGFVVTGEGEAERLTGARVSAGMFPMLGARVVAGRALLPADDAFGRGRVVVLSEALWRRRFGADRGVVGRAILLDGVPHAVVGVADGRTMLPEAELWTPLALAPYELAQRGDRPLAAVARLRDGVTLASARGDLSRAMRELAARHPESNADVTARVTPLHEEVVGSARTPLLLLLGATVVVLLVAGGNLAMLLLTRATGRRREIAMRVALGATRARVLRQLATESALLVAAGGALGVALAQVATRLLVQAAPALVPRLADVRVDGRVMGVAGCVLTIVAIALALVPMREATAGDLHTTLRTTALQQRRAGGVGLRDLLVTGQLAMALALLVGSGVLARSLWRVLHVELGFAPAGVLTATISLPGSRYPDGERRAAFMEGLRRRVAALGGVREAGLVSHLPLATGARGRAAPPLVADVVMEGSAGVNAAPRAHLTTATPGYFEAMRLRRVRGRGFSSADGPDARPVVVIDETLARALAPDGDAVGRRVRVGATLGADTAWREVVGIVAGVRRESVLLPPQPTVYVPHAQNPWPTLSLVVRTAGDPSAWAPAVRGQVRALDAELAPWNVQPLAAVVARAVALQRLEALLIGALAATVLVLAVLGVHGVLAWTVAQRTRELGIRVALGASRWAVERLVLGHVLARLAAGVAAGGALALASARVLRGVLYEVSPLDPVVVVTAVAVLTVAALVASWVPLRRAVRVDPVLAIREG